MVVGVCDCGEDELVSSDANDDWVPGRMSGRFQDAAGNTPESILDTEFSSIIGSFSLCLVYLRFYSRSGVVIDYVFVVLRSAYFVANDQCSLGSQVKSWHSIESVGFINLMAGQRPKSRYIQGASLAAASVPSRT